MSLLGCFLKPTCLPAAPIAARTISTCTSSRSRAHHEDRRHRRTCRGDIGGRAAVAGETTALSLEDIFVSSLVAAGICRDHKTGIVFGTKRSRLGQNGHVSTSRRQQTRRFSSHVRRYQHAVAAVEELPDSPQISREEYKELVNTYPRFKKSTLSKAEIAELAREKKRSEQHFPLAPRLVLTPEQEITKGLRKREPLPPEDLDHARQLGNFEVLLRNRKWGEIPHDELWTLFDNLRTPRLRYLDNRTVHRMFRHLAWVEYRPSQELMRRYLDLLNEALGEQVPVSPGIWNTALSFAGNWVRRVTSAQVKCAIELWMRMEESGTEATHVTLNILFLVAVKANRYALADTIFKELLARNMPLNRYFRASVIYYAGMRHDGEGVRQAFRDLVNAGEIVDTTIMNSVILGLVRSGEASAAENVYLRMKKLHEDKLGTLLPESWRTRKELGQVLNKTGWQLRKEQNNHEASFFGAAFSGDEKREQIQQATPIAPDSATYRILIKYHAHESGNIDKIRELLAEMQGRSLHVHGSVYVHLLRGFHSHGGWAFSKWSVGSLEELWKEIMTASAPPTPTMRTPESSQISDSFPPESVEDSHTDMLSAMLAEQASFSPLDPSSASESLSSESLPSELERPTYFTKAMAMAAIHAFHKCASSKRMLEVWVDITSRWHDANDGDHAAVQERVDRLATESQRRR
ncbi:hypothetical protein DOTSEDRAFT_72118 [Dothistroma septosporum NZE10]|uniref:Pentacotripeptide-repeat region of PRORP domain-containing protein n=1 Tax=Dothistroma septosporum (strain NZE10 / CBS 128990) TaxID=675120 RepID=N1PQ48_DOTSN|nr:hypothetical protein DOTSEDRAFT_72118 [Dothistroma septosporum NZE10]